MSNTIEEKKPLENLVEPERGLVGFRCPKDGSDRKFSYCWTECKEHCHPLPVLLALAHQFRPREGDIYHVTEILNPPRIVYDTRNYPYYLNPMLPYAPLPCRAAIYRMCSTSNPNEYEILVKAVTTNSNRC